MSPKNHTDHEKCFRDKWYFRSDQIGRPDSNVFEFPADFFAFAKPAHISTHLEILLRLARRAAERGFEPVTAGNLGGMYHEDEDYGNKSLYRPHSWFWAKVGSNSVPSSSAGASAPPPVPVQPTAPPMTQAQPQEAAPPSYDEAIGIKPK